MITSPTPVVASAGPKLPILAGLLAAVGASACCFAPLLLVLLGVGGVWAGRVRALEPFMPGFALAAVLFLGIAFWRLYVSPRDCAPGEACASPVVLRRQRALLWLVVAAAAGMQVFPLLASHLL